MDANKLTPLKRFWRLLVVDKEEIRNIYIYSVFNGLISLSLPLGIQAIVNLIQGGQVSTSWVVLVLMVVLGVAISGLLRIAQLRITENLQQKIFTRASFEFSYRIPRIRMERLHGYYAPELMNRFFDVVSVQKGLSKILIDFSSAFFLTVFSLILLSLYHPFFILFGFILIVLVYVIFVFTAQRGMTTSLDESKFKYKVAHWLEELSRTSIAFKLAGNTDMPLEKTNEYTLKYLESRNNHFKVLVQQFSLLVAFKVIVAAGLLIIGGKLVIDQQMNIGQFIAAEIIILIVLSSVEKLILSLENIYDILTSLEKIGFVTDLELESDGGIDLAAQDLTNGVKIELNHVKFTYPGDKKAILNDITTVFEAKSVNVITGVSGTGKSTLLHIIAGLYEPQEGTVAFNDIPIGNLSLNSTRDIIGEFLTIDKLFEGTIYENIAMGRPSVTFEDVQWAVTSVGLKEFVKGLPRGYDTGILTTGKGLPESIITKLLIARSIAAKPKVLLLENTFEHLDRSYSNEMIDFLTDRQHGWTIIAVSSNPYFIAKADKVLVLENNRIKHQGTYDELKKLNAIKL